MARQEALRSPLGRRRIGYINGAEKSRRNGAQRSARRHRRPEHSLGSRWSRGRRFDRPPEERLGGVGDGASRGWTNIPRRLRSALINEKGGGGTRCGRDPGADEADDGGRRGQVHRPIEPGRQPSSGANRHRGSRIPPAGCLAARKRRKRRRRLRRAGPTAPDVPAPKRKSGRPTTPRGPAAQQCAAAPVQAGLRVAFALPRPAWLSSRWRENRIPGMTGRRVLPARSLPWRPGPIAKAGAPSRSNAARSALFCARQRAARCKSAGSCAICVSNARRSAGPRQSST